MTDFAIDRDWPETRAWDNLRRRLQVIARYRRIEARRRATYADVRNPELLADVGLQRLDLRGRRFESAIALIAWGLVGRY